MLDKNLINDVKTLFPGDCSGHDFQHTMRVMNMAVKISEAEGADQKIAALIALLHDVDDVKLFGTDSHNAETLLQKYGYAPEVCSQVTADIKALSFSGTGKTIPHSPEGRIAQDADRLDAMGAIGIARTFAYGGSHNRMIYDPENPPASDMTESAYRSSQGSGINHFYEKLLRLRDLMNTPTARQIAENRHAVMLSFLEEFFEEVNGTK